MSNSNTYIFSPQIVQVDLDNYGEKAEGKFSSFYFRFVCIATVSVLYNTPRWTDLLFERNRELQYCASQIKVALSDYPTKVSNTHLGGSYRFNVQCQINTFEIHFYHVSRIIQLV